MTTTPHNTSGLPDNPFVAGPMIRDPRLFVGRKKELDQLTGFLRANQPVSCNIVGERRIGKSSLLYRFHQDHAAHVQERRFVSIFRSMQEGDCNESQEAFYRTLCRNLGPGTADRQEPNAGSWRAEFTALVRRLSGAGQVPLLCLDEFDALMARPHVFDLDFFDNLRALMEQGLLVLVMASREGVDRIASSQGLSSRFFNGGWSVPLGNLEAPEARDLVRLPASTVPGTRPALGMKDQDLALAWGGRHPLLLQLAGYCLARARQEGWPEKEARKEFEREKRRMLAQGRARFWSGLGAAGKGLQVLLDRLVKLADRVKEIMDRGRALVWGLAVLAALLLVLLGALLPGQALQWLDTLRNAKP